MAENKTSFQTILDALLNDNKDFPHRYLQFFSDLDPASLKAFLDGWPRVNPTRKLILLRQLEALVDTDTIVSFEDIGRALLKDVDGDVRAAAIRLLAESDDPKLADAYINILQKDTELEPRLEAATMLGEYVILGELEELDETIHHRIEDALLAVVSSKEDDQLRRRALEALGYSSRPEAETVIETAFTRASPEWVASALTAMGRSSDPQWEEQVITMLVNEDLRIRKAAVQAAGELMSSDARGLLLSMLEDEEDDEVIAAIIWSLSQIGGEDVRTYLEALLDKTEDEDENEDLLELIENALENLTFTEDLERFEMLALNPDDELKEIDIKELDNKE
jgi:HEAT repeat protein